MTVHRDRDWQNPAWLALSCPKVALSCCQIISFILVQQHDPSFSFGDRGRSRSIMQTRYTCRHVARLRSRQSSAHPHWHPCFHTLNRFVPLHVGRRVVVWRVTGWRCLQSVWASRTFFAIGMMTFAPAPDKAKKSAKRMENRGKGARRRGKLGNMGQ